MNPYQDEKLWAGYLKPSENELRRIRTTHSMMPTDDSKVLDLGCGTGAVTNDLRERFVVAVDITQTALRRSRSERVLADATRLPFRVGSFGLVISAELFEHLPDNSHARAAEEIVRLNPNTILISVPFQEDLELMSSFCKNCGTFFNAYHHYRSYEPAHFDGVFKEFTRDRTAFITHLASPSQWTLRLGRRFGYYRVIPGEVCSKCGTRVEYPPAFVRLVFGCIRRASLCINKILHRKKPYHMILRYCRHI